MVIIMITVACGKKDSVGNDKVILRFSWWGNTVRHEATLKVINRYMELNPDIVIEAEYGGWDGYYQKISTQLIGGIAPDIMQLDIPWLPELTKSDVFLDLYEYTDNLDISGFNESFMKSSGVYNDKLLSLPTGVNGYVLLFDSSLLEEFDITDNMTWNEFITIGEEVRNKYGDSKFLLMADSGALKDTVLRRVLIQRTGLNLADDNYNKNFGEENALEMFTILDNLYSKNILPSLENSLAYDNNWKEYPQLLNGNIFSGFDLISGIAAMQDFLPEVEWDSVSLPVVEGYKDTGTWSRPAQMLSVAKNTKHPEEAVKFLDFFYNNEEAIKILGTTRSAPAVDKALTILKESNILDPITAKATKVLMDNIGTPQNLAEYESTLSALDKEFIHTIALGQLSPAEAAKEYVKLYDEELERLSKLK